MLLSRASDVKIAVIGSPYGVSGMLHLKVLLQNVDDLISFSGLAFDLHGIFYDIKIISKKSIDVCVVKFLGIDSRNDAECLTGLELFIKRSSLPDLSDDSYYHIDLIGTSVFIENEDKKSYGVVKDVVNFGAEDLLEILPKNKLSSLYCPFNKDTVIKIDIKRREIFIRRTPYLD